MYKCIMLLITKNQESIFYIIIKPELKKESYLYMSNKDNN